MSLTYVIIYYLFLVCYVPHPPPPPSFDDNFIVFSEQCVLRFNHYISIVHPIVTCSFTLFY
jgi:hypothetical protein